MTLHPSEKNGIIVINCIIGSSSIVFVVYCFSLDEETTMKQSVHINLVRVRMLFKIISGLRAPPVVLLLMFRQSAVFVQL